MHEYGIAKEIMHVIEEHVKANEGSKPLRCHLKVGPLSGVNPEWLEAAMPMAMKDSIGENVEYIITLDPITCKCRNCGSEINIDEFIDLLICESCGSSDIEHPPHAIKLLLTRLELEKDGEILTIELDNIEVEEEEHEHEH
jgi:hydrogenase nickel incorporation protein HypA/HybF